MERTYLLTPVSRLVSGDPTKARTVDGEGNPLVVKSGPRMGQPREDYYMGIAMPKNNPKTAEFIAALKAVGAAAFPKHVASPTFSWKLTDGDSKIPNAKGKVPCENEGYPGHWILNCSNGFPPTFHDENAQPMPSDRIYRGCYVRANVSVTGNGSSQSPGVYVGATMVQFCGHGEKISVGPDAATVFSAPMESLPQGASATPLAPAVAPPPPPPVAQITTRYLINGQEFDEADLLAQGWTTATLARFPKA